MSACSDDSLHLSRIAEGIETPSNSRSYGPSSCRSARGFLFSRSMPVAAIDFMLESGGEGIADEVHETSSGASGA